MPILAEGIESAGGSTMRTRSSARKGSLSSAAQSVDPALPAKPLVPGGTAPSNSMSKRQQQILTLNNLVRTRAENAVVKAKTRGEEVEVDVVWALKPKTPLTAGYPVYEDRSGLVVAGLTLLSSYMVLLGAQEFGVVATLCNLAVAFFCYDLFSGVLHIVLDDPHNIEVPLLGQPALEFQWHHRLPHDIASKSFTDVVGDLNVVSLILVAIHFTYSAKMGTDALAMQLTGFKLWMAYFGQFSHRSAHIHTKLHPVAQALQSMGVMISTKDHRSHHTPPHDTDFCLIGIMNPILAAARRITTNRHFWLVAFLAMSIFDIKAEVYLCGSSFWHQAYSQTDPVDQATNITS